MQNYAISETWKAVADCPKYKISSHGNIIGPSGKLLKPIRGHNGYDQIVLSLGSRSTSRRYIHRMVAEAFLGEIPKDHVVNHKDHDKRHNRVDNLEIISRKANASHWAKKGRIKGQPRRDLQEFCLTHGKLFKVYPSGRHFCEACRTEKRERRSVGSVLIPPPDCRWKQIDVSGYLVSDDGRVWSCKNEKVLRPGVNGVGYAYVNIDRRNRAIHRLVAEAYVKALGENEVVDHVDGDKLNNRADNLRPVTRSANTIQFWHAKRKNSAKATSNQKLTSEDALEIVRLHSQGMSQNKLAVQFKVARFTIQEILGGRRFRHLFKSSIDQ